MSDFTWARLRFSSGSVITLSGPRFLWALKTSPDQSRYLVPQTLRPSSFFPHIAPSRSGEPLALKNAQASCFFGAAWVRSVSIRTSERWSFHVFFWQRGVSYLERRAHPICFTENIQRHAGLECPWLPANEWRYSAAMRTAVVLVGTGEHNAAGESL